MSDFDFSLNDIEAQFMDFMRANNCEPEGNFTLQMDGQLHRFRLHDDRNGQKSGAYCVHTDGWPAGWCQNWRGGETVMWKFAVDDEGKHYDYFSSPEFKKALENSKKHQAEIKAEQDKKRLEAIDQARRICASLPNADYNDEQPYLCNKQIFPYNLKINRTDQRLIVPIQDIDGNIVNVQYIEADGDKKFLPFAPVSANFYAVGLEEVNDTEEGKKKPILIGEGVATMHTIREMTELPCVAAMNCGNIKKVAEAIRGKYPNPIIIMADNDHKKKQNAGKEAAEAANRELKLNGVVMPDFADDEDGTDWNDFFVMHDYDSQFCRDAIRKKFGQLPLFDKRAKYKTMAQTCGVLRSEYFTSFTKPLPGKNSLIEDWIPTESLMMMFAPSGSGKGFVAVDLAYSIATPEIEEWHGKTINTHGPVVYLAGEGQKGLRKRFAGIANYKNVDTKNTKLAVITEAVPINDPNTATGIDLVIANIGMLYPDPVLVILDTTNRYMFGDENKTADATSFINAATKIMNEFHCSVLVIHHTGVNPETQGRARGSSVLHANIDMEFKLSKSITAPRFITLEMTKSKDTEFQKPIVFEMIQVPAPGFFKDSGDPDNTCVIKHNDELSEAVSKGKQKGEKMSKTERFARDTYREAAIEFGKIIQEPGSARSTVAVDIEDWRKLTYQRSSADKDNTKRGQFNRSRAVLLEEKKILFKQIIDGKEYYCLLYSEDEYFTSIMAEITNRESKGDNGQ